ncbi:DSC E3 ubiquitin ligase complex subunit 3 [Psilocybe cubensis]|uniref:Ubiquitin-like domain-containing protein n=2 Tax=Psilocybe cubensis TaxID=181762 RepID=A0A8H7Y2V7_PSICU|nr:DSC E3 ubiquitin ligase complex subunit 3 [Psilocybe cubensis]KAH9485144.1 DSC E3 ubiquitin ligase complex subunit 3 [Psilocybe cubensis]
MLSDRAKGKQRAVDPLPHVTDDAECQDSSNGFPDAESRNLVIRFTEGTPDLTVRIDKLDSVLDVKQRIRQMRPDLQKNRLRLIHSGRLLPDSTFVYAWLASLDERQQRTNKDDQEPIAGGDTDTMRGDASTAWIHCSVGPVIERGVEEDVQTSQIQPVRGFDRLASVGFSAAEIATIREQFHNQSISNYLDTDFATQEEYDEHARILEEQWMENSTPSGPLGLGDFSLLQGVLTGFFFPFLPFFFWGTEKPAAFWEDGTEQEPTSNTIISTQMSMAIVIGFCANILFGIWFYLLES